MKVDDSWHALAKEIELDTLAYHNGTKETGDLMFALREYLLSHDRLCLVPLCLDARPLAAGIEYTLYYAKRKSTAKGWDIITEYPKVDAPQSQFYVSGLRSRQVLNRFLLFVERVYDPTHIERCETAVRTAIRSEEQGFAGGVYVGRKGEIYMIDELQSGRIFPAKLLLQSIEKK
ncbi:MAG: hypothetical protein HY513_01075 [Candidatus Aenigmarchaeota archaeon]|nr:hypothetical protein [Candidatus Aenigmarchaeota archaeon]